MSSVQSEGVRGVTPEIPGYRIEHVLGRGGMGVVYLGVQERLNRKVALKVIVPELAADPVFRQRFEQEAEHAASIDHPNVVPIYEANEVNGSLYLAMRFVDGDDLGTILRQTSGLPAASAAAIVSQVAAALDAAHAGGLVHRDIKPANILIEGGRPDGHVYLTDFGLTKTAEAQASFTHTGRFVGTLDYAAPEQIEGGVTDARTDVYALTCVLWHALTGEPPYEGGDAQKMWAHMHHEPPSFDSIKPRLSASFGDVIARGMAKDPADRYPSAGDLGRAAVAASGGHDIELPERTVATGVAAAGIPSTKTMSAAHPAAPTRDISRASGSEARTISTAAPSNKRWLPVLIGSILALVVMTGVAAGAVLITDDDATPEEKVAPKEKRPAPREEAVQKEPEKLRASKPIGGEAPEGTVGSSQTKFVPYRPSDSAYDYTATIPTGGGWLEPTESYPTGGALLRTSVRGPAGQFVLIDRTPSEEPQLGGGFDSSGVIQHPRYGTVVEYVISESALIPECDGYQCVDYLINDGSGGGWGVLAGGSDVAVAKQTAQEVALSISD